MVSLAPYLNFDGTCEEAMKFYAAGFQTEMKFMAKFGDMEMDGLEVSEEEIDRVLHAAFSVGDGLLMASDILPSMGQTLTVGNNSYISVHPDSREEADRLFRALSKGGKVEIDMHAAEWGDYFGSFKDKFGIGWMIAHKQG